MSAGEVTGGEEGSSRFQVVQVETENEAGGSQQEACPQTPAKNTEAVYYTVGPEDIRQKDTQLDRMNSLPAENSAKKHMKIRKISSIPVDKKQLASRNGNMVLQLVLSPDSINREESNYLTSSSSSNNESMSINLLKYRDRVGRSSDSTAAQDNTSRVTSPVYVNRAFSHQEFPRDPTLQIYTREDEEEEPGPESTNDEDKKKMFKKQLTIILSCIYAVFIVTLGLVIYISDIIIESSALAETYSIYLLIVGFVYMVYLVVDIRMYVNKVRERCRQGDPGLVECRESIEGDLHLSVPLPSWSEILSDAMPHKYCFSKGRHSGSFYLKVGAAGFCLGHLIHSGLLLGYQIVFLTSDGDAFYECASVATLVLDIIYPIYSFFLLYVIFKYSNVIINTRMELGRFALMHCIASSLCFWIWTILRETTDSLSHYKFSGSDDNIADNDNDDDSSEENFSEFFKGEDVPIALSLTSYGKTGAKKLVDFFNVTTSARVGTICSDDSRLDVIYKYYSPYLYPFTVEYSILVVGVLFIIWQNIGKCQKFEDDKNGNRKHCPTPGYNKENGFASNLVIHVDCHSSNTGLFCGILVIVSAVVSIILFFIAISNPKYVHIGTMVNIITELVFVLLMTVTSVFAYKKITQLDVNYHQVSLLDDLLLFICIPAFFLHAIFSIVPAVQEQNGVSIAHILLQVIQILIQTPFIIDGLRRCSNSRRLRLEKPGRGLVTFLVVCNVAMWITETFEIKSQELLDSRYEFYGKVWWTVIGHMTVPLTMFYRFHSSVCLVDIWKSAYEPSERH